MLAQQPAVGAEEEEGAVERAAAVRVVPLDDADREVHAGSLGGLTEPAGHRPGHFDRACAVARPRAPPLRRPPSDRGSERETPRVPAHERLGEEHQLRAALAGARGEAHDLLDGRVTVEEHGRRLHDRGADALGARRAHRVSPRPLGIPSALTRAPPRGSRPALG